MFSDPEFTWRWGGGGGWGARRELGLQSTINSHPQVVQTGTLKVPGDLEESRADQLGRASKPTLGPHLAPRATRLIGWVAIFELTYIPICLFIFLLLHSYYRRFSTGHHAAVVFAQPAQ